MTCEEKLAEAIERARRAEEDVISRTVDAIQETAIQMWKARTEAEALRVEIAALKAANPQAQEHELRCLLYEMGWDSTGEPEHWLRRKWEALQAEIAALKKRLAE